MKRYRHSKLKYTLIKKIQGSQENINNTALPWFTVQM